MTSTISHWIDGKLATPANSRTATVWNPATGEAAAEVVLASQGDIEAAVTSASAAARTWRSSPLSRRAEILFQFRALLAANRQRLAEAITREHGKTVADALGEIARGLENVEFACGAPALLKGGFSEQASNGVDVYQIRQPLGVVAGITPFNFPAMVPLWMFPNAIMCGNAFILKPSEKDPSASLILAELLQQAGLPDGVFTVLQGDHTAANALIEHPEVKAISFVGSTPVAKAIYEAGTRLGKRVQALGGAKNHMVVLPDADIAMAADAAVSAAYGSAGERCMAISVLVAVGSAAEPVIAAIRERIAKIRIGPGNDPKSEMGPLITREHRDRVASYVDNAGNEGATVVVAGEQPTTAGFFLGASLLDHVKPGMACYDQEIFGPVLSVVRVETYAEAVRLVNENPFGNGVAIFTRDGGAARQFQFDVEVGMVGINVPIPVPVSYYSFGGWKASLFGDLHMYGPRASSSTREPKWLPAAGPIPPPAKSTSGSRRIADPRNR